MIAIKSENKVININLNKLDKINTIDICQDTFPKVAGIYYCYCIANNKGYVGQTNNLHRRIVRNHIKDLKANQHKNKSWQYSWNKYGEEAFVWSILEQCKNDERMNDREQFWINELGTLQPKGFNMTTGGDKNFVYSEEQIQKIKDRWTEERRIENGKRSKEYWNSLSKEEQQDFGKKISNAYTDERKKQMSEFKKDFWSNITDEKRQEIRKKHIANHHDVSGAKNPKAKAIRCIETGEIFTTMKSAAQYFHMDYSTIKRHMRGIHSHAKGLHFEFVI